MRQSSNALDLVSPNPEARLLLRCLSCCLGAVSDAVPVQLFNGEGFIRLAFSHGVACLARRGLQQFDPEGIDCAFAAELAVHCDNQAARGLELCGELLKLLPEFSSRGIQVAAFKGPALALDAYGDVALRSYCDLDLLVMPGEVLAASSALEDWGFVREVNHSLEDWPGYVARNCELNFDRSDPPVHVELHWAVLPPCFVLKLTSERLCRGTRSLAIGRRQVPVPPVESLLVALCAHGVKHAWGRLIWTCDVAGLLRRHPDMDWRDVWSLCAEVRCTRVVCVGLWLAREVTGVLLPPSVAGRLMRDELVGWCGRIYLTWCFRPSQSALRQAAQWIVYGLSRECWRDRVTLVLWGLRWLVEPNEEDRRALPLPKWLAWGYGIVRPVRLLLTYLPGRTEPAPPRN